MSNVQIILVAAEATRLISISDFQPEPPYVGCYESNGGVISQPGRAKDNSPPIYPWVARCDGNKSRQGRQKPVWCADVFFRPSGAWGIFDSGYPPLKRWAIFGRPCGTNTTGGVGQ
jgi:hypothetical protein